MKIEKPFFVDPQYPGIVRGGFYDEMGGMLVGVEPETGDVVLGVLGANGLENPD